jgi:hypothetical protein
MLTSSCLHIGLISALAHSGIRIGTKVLKTLGLNLQLYRLLKLRNERLTSHCPPAPPLEAMYYYSFVVRKFRVKRLFRVRFGSRLAEGSCACYLFFLLSRTHGTVRVGERMIMAIIDILVF